MMPFGGFDMPVQYTSIIEEHLAVRQAAGLFDVSHMGEFLVEGPGAFDYLQRLVTNDISKLYDGRAQYTVMCHPSGGAVDDLLVYRMSEERYMLVVNASNIEKDFSWAKENLQGDVNLTDVSEQTGLLALQGPKAMQIAQALTSIPLADIKYYHFQEAAPEAFMGLEGVILSHTGYTGEAGLEIYCQQKDTARIWAALMEAGAAHGLLPAGLGARDTLRLESGFCLYGHELDDDTTPLEAGLGWVTKLDKGEFIGRETLQAQKQQGIPRKLVGFVMEDRGIPRAGYSVVNAAGETIGTVTSGSQSPLLKKGIGLAFVTNDAAYTNPGTGIGIDIRGKQRSATVAKPPFHKS